MRITTEENIRLEIGTPLARVPRVMAPVELRGLWSVAIFGISIPLLAMLVELSMRLCTSLFFDPLPSVWHTLLFTTIPLSSLFTVWVVGKQRAALITPAYWLNGFALGVAAVFTLQFLPILIISIIALLALGFGIFGLSPLLSLFALFRCRRYLCATASPLPRLWPAVAIGALLMIAVELPVELTVLGLEMASSETLTTQQQGYHLLRAVGNRSVLLQACYENPRTTGTVISELLGTALPAQPAQSRTIYYRITGLPFNSATRPRTYGDPFFGESMTDREIGGAAVAGRVEGLSLTASRLDGSLDADTALGYLEWTLTFKNANSSEQEARTQLALPPGAVVSRATLWINGEEREAAFAARGHARQAYQQVAVVQQRDPLLVTSCGPDRVLVQCYPVPPNGGVMKIRLGITTPLRLTQRDTATLALPRMVESNFATADALQHAVWIDSTGRLTTGTQALSAEANPSSHAYTLRGNLTDAALATPIRILRNPLATQSWTTDPVRPQQIIRQHIVEAPATPPTRLVVVLDGSQGMAQSAKAVMSLPLCRTIETTVLLAGDEVTTLMPSAPLSEAFVQKYAQKLTHQRFIGGMNNIPALEQAWDYAAQQPHSAILWLHGPQPLAATADPLLQRWQRRPDGPRLYDLQVQQGANTVLEALDGVTAVSSVPLIGSVQESVTQYFANWMGLQWMVERSRTSQEHASGTRTSAHLARLWARDSALTFTAQHTPAATESAIAMASAYHLVTPVTGAVVLQTKQQYHENGLAPVKPGSVPTVPEPEEWLLMATVLLLLAGLWWRRRTVARMA